MSQILLSVLFAVLGLCFGFFVLGNKKELSVAVVNAIVWGACLYLSAPWTKGAVYALTGSLLLAAALADLKTKHIPDRYQICFFLLGMGVSLADEKGATYHFYGMIFAAVLFIIVYLVGRLVLRTDGIGLGDVKLLIGCGLFLGILRFCLALGIAVVYAALEGIVAWVIRCIRRDKAEQNQPFSPYIVTGFLVALLW